MSRPPLKVLIVDDEPLGLERIQPSRFHEALETGR